MPKKNADHLFEEFFRVPSKGSPDGVSGIQFRGTDRGGILGLRSIDNVAAEL
jgi:hypothetical protein